jgi:chromosome segregation ATPase
MADDEILSGPAMQAKKFKETDEEKAFYRDYTAMYDLNSMKTAFNGYDKKEVRNYLTKILNDRTEEEKAANKIIDDLRSQIATLKKDKEESIQKYNKLLLAKISGNDTGAGGASSEELARAKKESEDFQKKVLMLSGQLSSAKAEKAKADKQIEELNATIEELKNSNVDDSTFADAKKLLLGQISDLKNQLSDLQDSNNNLTAELQKANTDKDGAITALNDLQPKYDDLKQKLDSSEADFQKTREGDVAKIADLQKQVDDLTAKNKDLADKSEYANDMKEAFMRSSASEKEAIQAKKAAEGKVRALTLKNESMERENKQLRGSLAQLQETIEENKNYTAKLEEELNNVYSAQMGEQSETAANVTEEDAGADTNADGQSENADDVEQLGA